MPINDLQAFSSQGLRQLRGINNDGTVTIVCRVCGKPLYRGMYQGFSTATCSDCSGVSTADMITGAVTLPDGRVIYQPAYADDALLYQESPEVEKIGLARAVFRALGFGRSKEPRPKSVESSKISKEKRRKPIFGPDDPI